MPRTWTPADVLQLASAYQSAAILAAAADLDLFTQIGALPFTAADAARTLHADERALTILLDALASLGLLEKQSHHYQAPPSVIDLLTPTGSNSVLAMAQHQANCLRR